MVVGELALTLVLLLGAGCTISIEVKVVSGAQVVAVTCTSQPSVNGKVTVTCSGELQRDTSVPTAAVLPADGSGGQRIGKPKTRKFVVTPRRGD